MPERFVADRALVGCPPPRYPGLPGSPRAIAHETEAIRYFFLTGRRPDPQIPRGRDLTADPSSGSPSRIR
ncbi:MAG: hypothetical protein HYW63_03065 [Candidatus Levybacteria bacterium]|nr:hypothetical protein [Candidatus Levybacteria bacterium]